MERARVSIGSCGCVSVSLALPDSAEGRNRLISFRRKERFGGVGRRADCRMWDVLVVQASWRRVGGWRARIAS